MLGQLALTSLPRANNFYALKFNRPIGKYAMSDISSELVADELKHQLMPVPLTARPILLEAIANLISKHVAAERTRCRALCEQRAELWLKTKGGTGPLAQEARSRANEAIYIADLLG